MIGAAQVAVLPASSASGVRGVLYTEVKVVEPGRLVTTESVVTGAFEQIETIRFLEHPDGGVMVECSAWVDTVPMTEARSLRLRHNLSRLQRGYLARAHAWAPGTRHQPNIIHPESDDLAYLG